MQQTILILGSNGKTGSRLAHKLRARGIHHFKGTRNPTTKDERLFDWEDESTFASAFEGIDQLYIVAPTNRADHGNVMPPALEIAKAQGVKRFVLLSAAALPKGGPMMGAAHQWLEDNVSDWAVIRPSWFMQNILEPRHLASIKHEQSLYSATANGKLGFIDADDIAEVALAAFQGTEAWNCDEVLTGSEPLSYADLAQHISKHIGNEVSHINLSVPELAQKLKVQGLTEDYAQLLASLDGAIAKGPDETLSDAVLRRTGKEPTTFAAFLKREGAALLR